MARRSSKRCSASHRTSVARRDCGAQHQTNSLLSKIWPGSSCTPVRVGTTRRGTIMACCLKPMAGHARRHTPSPHSCTRQALVIDATKLRAQVHEEALTHHLGSCMSVHTTASCTGGEPRQHREPRCRQECWILLTWRENSFYEQSSCHAGRKEKTEIVSREGMRLGCSIEQTS